MTDIIALAHGTSTWLGLIIFAVTCYFFYSMRKVGMIEKTLSQAIAGGNKKDIPKILDTIKNEFGISIPDLPDKERANIAKQMIHAKTRIEGIKLFFALCVLLIIVTFVFLKNEDGPSFDQRAAHAEFSFRVGQVAELIDLAQRRINSLQELPDDTVLNRSQQQQVRHLVNSIGEVFAAPLHVGLFRKPTAYGDDATEWIGYSGFSVAILPAKSGFENERSAAFTLSELARMANFQNRDLDSLKHFYHEIRVDPSRYYSYEALIAQLEPADHTAKQARQTILNATQDFEIFSRLWGNFVVNQ